MNPYQVSFFNAKEKLRQSGQEFLSLFTHSSLEVELYQPNKIDRQQPHEQDELYIVASGSGKFQVAEEIMEFQKGDFLFVPAKVEHRFFDFSDDFSTWVVFYGKKGGEQGRIRNTLMERS